MKRVFVIFEVVMTSVFLFFYCGTPFDVFITSNFTVGSPIFPVLFNLSYFVSISYLFLSYKKTFYLIFRCKLTWILIGLSLVSTLWSIDPSLTTRRAFALIGTSLFGLYLASRYSLKHQLKILAVVFSLSFLFCFLYALLLPSYGVSFDGGIAWKGIYITKNVLGKRALLASIVFLMLSLTTKNNKPFLFLYFISFLLLVLSGSKGALVYIILITLVSVILPFFSWKTKIMIPVLSSLLGLITLTGFWVFFSLHNFLESLGRDVTLTGRTPLWSLLGEKILEKLYLGYGYGVFWLSSEAKFISRLRGWEIPNAHNGFLDLCVSLGIIGLTIFLFDFVAKALQGVSHIRDGYKLTGLWVISYMIFIILSNLTETSLFEQNSIEWLIYVAAISSSQLPLIDDP